MGEASKMENFLITDAYNLTLRPGIQRADFAAERTPAPILGSWAGRVGEDDLLVICDFYQNADRLFVYQRGADGNRHIVHQQTGALGLTSGEAAMVKIFPFGGKLYVMSKGNTVVYKDGTFTAEAPYVPLVITGAAPAGGGTTLENLNLLTALRRIEYSADGEATAYVLPEEAIGVTAITVDNVAKDVAASGSFDASKHTYTFTAAPVKGVANVEFTYTTDAAAAAENRLKILGCPLVEAYTGASVSFLLLELRRRHVIVIFLLGKGDLPQIRHNIVRRDLRHVVLPLISGSIDRAELHRRFLYSRRGRLLLRQNFFRFVLQLFPAHI